MIITGIAAPPAAEEALEALLPLADLKRHCRVDSDDEAALLAAYRATAFDWLERVTGEYLAARAVEVIGYDPAPSFTLPVWPVRAVAAARRLLDDGALGDVDPALYRVAIGCDPAIVSGEWPETIDAPDAFRFSVEVGYAEAAPAALIQAARLLVAHSFRNRETVVIGASASSVPFSVLSLIGSFRRGCVA